MHGKAGQRTHPEGDTHTILVVEDEVLVRLLIAEQLRGAGFNVIEAANADEAVTVLTYAPDVAVLISDIRMPGVMDGLALARKVSADHPSIYIVLTSGHLGNVASDDHDAFFSKPYNGQEVLEHIRTVLRDEKP